MKTRYLIYALLAVLACMLIALLSYAPLSLKVTTFSIFVLFSGCEMRRRYDEWQLKKHHERRDWEAAPSETSARFKSENKN